MNFKTCMFAASAVFLAAGSVRAEVGVTDTEIKIGEVSILSGTTSQIGAGFTAGTRVAVAEINAKGGINGRKLVLVEEDDGAQPARGFQAAKKLIQQDQVFSFNGTSCSACVLAMLPLFEQNNVPVIVSLAPIQSVYSPLRPNIFTIGASYTEAFYATTKYIHEKREPKDAVYGIVRMDEAFGESIEQAYNKAVKDFGLKDAIKLKYKPGQTDFATEALQLKQAGVNVLIDGAVTSGAASLFTNLRKADATMQFANVWTELMPASMKLQATAGYTYLVSDYVADVNEPAGQKIVELAKKYAPNDVAAINRYTFMSYVSMQVFASAAAKCGKDLTRACLISELAKTNNLDVGGLMAPITFDKAEQRAGREVRIYEVDAAKQTVKALTDFR